MDDLIEIMSEILEEIREMNRMLYSIHDCCEDNICNKIDEIRTDIVDLRGVGIYDTISDVSDKIDSLERTIMRF